MAIDLIHTHHIDPLFFLHHANMDRIWQKWKDFNPANARVVGGGTIKNLSAYDTYPVSLLCHFICV